MDAAQPTITNVINLSSRSLSDDCISALGKGLSFVPTTYCNDFDTLVDFQKFFRTLRLKEFFHSNRGRATTVEAHLGHPLPTSPEVMETEPIFDSGSYKTAFKKKSTFIPPKHRNSSIDTYCRLVESEVSLLLSKKSQHKVANNLSKTQRNALLELKKDMSVVVQSADKGGAIVV